MSLIQNNCKTKIMKRDRESRTLARATNNENNKAPLKLIIKHVAWPMLSTEWAKKPTTYMEPVIIL